jgi:hypothetical protein
MLRFWFSSLAAIIRAMNQLVNKLKGHIEAVPLPRDTLERCLADIERLRRRVIEHRARDIEMRRLVTELARTRRRIAELEQQGRILNEPDR